MVPWSRQGPSACWKSCTAGALSTSRSRERRKPSPCATCTWMMAWSVGTSTTTSSRTAVSTSRSGRRSATSLTRHAEVRGAGANEGGEGTEEPEPATLKTTRLSRPERPEAVHAPNPQLRHNCNQGQMCQAQKFMTQARAKRSMQQLQDVQCPSE